MFLDEATRRLIRFSFGECILDSSQDAYPIYEFLNEKDNAVVINLNPRNTGNAKPLVPQKHLDILRIISTEHSPPLD